MPNTNTNESGTDDADTAMQFEAAVRQIVQEELATRRGPVTGRRALLATLLGGTGLAAASRPAAAQSGDGGGLFSDDDGDGRFIDELFGGASSSGVSGNVGEFDAVKTPLLIDRETEVQYDVGALLTGTTVASDQVQLSSGAATVTTDISEADATFILALGVDDPDADVKVTGRLFWDDSAATYKVELVEDGTNVGNPTVNYDVIRVR